MNDDLNHKNGHTNPNEIDDFLSQFDDEGPKLEPDQQKINEFEKITDDLSKTLNKTRIFKSDDDIEKSVSGTGRRTADVSGNDASDQFSPARPSRVERLSGTRKSSLLPVKDSEPVEFAQKKTTISASREEIDPLWNETMDLPRLPRLSLLKNKVNRSSGSMADEEQQESNMGSKGKKGKKKKKRRIMKRLLVTALVLGLIMCVAAGVVVASIIGAATPIDPNDLYSRLPENSTVYASDGTQLEIIETGGLRTNVGFDEMPTHLVEAFISIEDKTFWTHKGFNFIRIFGAIWEGVSGGGRISGTSTITQQLARNLYLTDTRFDYSYSRKIVEAYYSVELEKKLSKEQIIRAYLNTIYLGNQANGVQAAARSYFNKDVWDLNLAESAVLAALAQSPNRFAPIKKDTPEKIGEIDEELILHEDSLYVYYYNEGYRNRQVLVLDFMLEQEKITPQEYNEAIAYDIKGAVQAAVIANQVDSSNLSSYFVDYALEQVISDLMEMFNIDKDEATKRLYSGGYHIHTTLNPQVQGKVEEIFSNTSYFPGATALNFDGDRNIRSKNNSILLYNAENYFIGFTGEEERFVLYPDEYTISADGKLTIYAGKRLNFRANGNIDFKNLYYYDFNKVLNTIDGGTIQIPADYKELDSNGNMVISAQLFSDPKYTIYRDGEYVIFPASSYTLQTAVMQPQSAMVIMEHDTGQIIAMVGGRSIGQGRLLYNRATNPRQPGSSIKPIGVYAPALQASGIDGHVSAEGKYWTAATGVEDSPLNLNGRSWPKNWYSGYRGMQTVRTAIEQSTNTVAVKVFNDIGPDISVAMLENLGVSTIEKDTSVANDLNPAALALGGMTRGISPLEMAAAYGAFPNGGVYTEPVAYTQILTRNGDVVLQKTPKTTQAMDEGVAWIMSDLLQSTVSSGLASRAQGGIGARVAGKTGTTSDNFDAWFVGYTPKYSAAVWIGNDVNIELTRGSVAALEVWNRVMREVLPMVDGNSGSFDRTRPSNVTTFSVDSVSGLRPTGFSKARSEYFIIGTTPNDYDTYNRSMQVCGASQMLITPWCPEDGLVTKSQYDEATGQYWTPPSYYCYVHNQDTGLYPTGPSDSDDTYEPDDGEEETPDGDTGGGTSDGGTSGGNGSGSDNGSPEIPIVDTNDGNDIPEDEEDPVASSVPDWLRVE